MAAIPVTSLTESTTAGGGVFDVLMRSVKAHLEGEYQSGRIKGSEYATVYLGAIQSVLQSAVQFLLAKEKSAAEIAEIEARTALINQQKLNAVTEGTVLVAQECKLRAEYDVLLATKLKVNEEIALLGQKRVTEAAQTTALGVDEDSVVGRQKALYVAQTNGFSRDAEQKAAKLLVDTWNVRRTTDEATVADATNLLNDATIGRAITKLLAGVGA